MTLFLAFPPLALVVCVELLTRAELRSIDPFATPFLVLYVPALMLVPAALLGGPRSSPGDDESEGGGGLGAPAPAPRSPGPGGGIPLPDAIQARSRRRESARAVPIGPVRRRRCPARSPRRAPGRAAPSR